MKFDPELGTGPQIYSNFPNSMDIDETTIGINGIQILDQITTASDINTYNESNDLGFIVIEEQPQKLKRFRKWSFSLQLLVIAYCVQIHSILLPKSRQSQN